MKILNIFKSELDERFKSIADSIAAGHELKEVKLYDLQCIDYDQLLELIFTSDKVYSWW